MRTLPSWQLPFLGLKAFPRGLTEFEIETFFGFDDRERAAIHSRRGDNLRFAAALHLGFLKMTGTTMDAFDRVPLAVLWHLSNALDLPHIELATLRALYRRRRRTLFEHQCWAMDLLEIRPFTDGRQRAMVRALRSESPAALSVSELLVSIKTWLYTRGILIPANRRIRQLAGRVHREVEIELSARIIASIPEGRRDWWWQALYEPKPERSTHLEWLQSGPGKRSPSALQDLVARFQFLQVLGVHHHKLDGIGLERQRRYAQRCRRRKPARLQALAEPRRTLELVCFLRITLLQTVDQIFSLGDLRTTDLRRDAQNTIKSQEHKELITIRSLLRRMYRVAADEAVSDASARQYVLAEVPESILEECSRAERFRQALTDDRFRVRRLLRDLLTPRLECRDDSRFKRLLEQWLSLDCRGRRNRQLPDGFEAAVPKSWQPLINQTDRKQARQALDSAVLLDVQKALRNGTAWAPYSLSYISRNAMLLDDRVWSAHRKRHYRALDLPRKLSTFLAPRLAMLRTGLAGVAEAVSCENLTIDRRGVHLERLLARDQDRALTLARKRLFDEIGPVQLPEIIVAIDQEVRFSRILLGRAPRNRRELLTVYGGLLAHGTSRSASDVSLMMPEITDSAISDAMQLLERHDVLRAANDTVVAFMHRHTITRLWGSGQIASADAMSLDASRHLWNARVDPRRRTYGMGLYQHLLDRWGIIYDQPIMLGTRQAGAAIEGAVRQTTVDSIERLAVDTHGYTDFAMGLARLLGFDLCPRLKNLRDRTLHVPKGIRVPSTLAAIVRKDIRFSVSEANWDELVRLTASIRTGHTSAVLVLQRFGTAARGDPLYRAGTALGQLERSLFLCDVLTNRSFRRELSRNLSHVESFHALQRAIYFGSIQAARGRRQEELLAISGSLTLLTNLVMAWNTQQMQRVMIHSRPERPIDSDHFRHIAPTHHRYINFGGRFEFPIEAAAGRLLSPVAATNR